MNKIFNLTSNFKAIDENEDGSVNIKGYASTNDQDRAGDIVDPTAWSKGGIGNYENNPIILFNHDYHNPIGKTPELGVDARGLKIKGKISKSAGKVSELIKEGVLGAFSVGFRVKDADYIEETDGYRIKDAELFEISVVSVPANQAATCSVAKAFDSDDEEQDWKSNFVKIGQSTDVDSPEATVNQTVLKETKMSETKENFDLEEFAKEVAKKTATEIAMAQAEKQAKADAEAEQAAQAQVTARWEADLKHGSWLSKNIRPITLVFLTAVFVILSVFDGNLGDFTIAESYVPVYQTLLITVYGAYFAGRSIEKVRKVTK